MEIKYEPVFGDQSLFDNGIGDSVAAINHGDVVFCFNSYNAFLIEVMKCNDLPLSDVPEFAMRRIIRTPTWTVADQKAGKLPEVGCRVNFCHKLNSNRRTGEIKYIDDQVVVIRADDVAQPFVYAVERVEFKPIESPEEKAARLRVEWCKKAIGCAPISSEMQHYEMKRLGEYIGNIYDALLSGDLPVPIKE